MNIKRNVALFILNFRQVKRKDISQRGEQRDWEQKILSHACFVRRFYGDNQGKRRGNKPMSVGSNALRDRRHDQRTKRRNIWGKKIAKK